MKILLDECLPLNFRHSFPSHSAQTVQWAGLKGKKNGDLLHAAEIAGYEVLLTVDQGIPHQAHANGPEALNHPSPFPNESIEDLVPPVDAILQALETIQPGQTLAIPSSD